MTNFAISYAFTLVAFLAIDFLWLAWLAKPIYTAEMGALLRQEPNYGAAAAFYLLYAGGLVFFAVSPALKSDSVLQALGLGAALGLIAYGTYNLTNLAVLNGFGLRLGLIDMAWGTFASAATAALAFSVARRFIAA